MSEKRYIYTFECNGNNCQIFENDVWLKIEEVVDLLNGLSEENQRVNKSNKVLYDENIQLREKLLHFMNLKDDVKYLEEKGVF